MQRHLPAWLHDAIFYQIYPQSFFDSNNDGIGDLKGIIAKLDYVQALGCNGIWINPCFVSPFQDAGYDVSDYYKIAPRYGTNNDMKRLCQAAAKRGIRILLDLVSGHTSVEHLWFKASCKAGQNEYTNQYIWNDSIWGDTDGLPFVAGYGERSGKYVPNFFYYQPALNYGFAKPDPEKSWQLPVDHPDVLALREEMKKIMRFWLDMGVSGFRVDMASSLVKKDENSVETSRFWGEVREMLEREYPEAVLIAEWGWPERAIAAGFHMDFILPFTPATRGMFYGKDKPDHSDYSDSFFHPAGKGDAAAFFQFYLRHYQATRGQGYISIPSGNHDSERINSGRNARDLEMIFAFILTMPGVPFIYYGDEIGMRNLWGLTSKEGGYNRTVARTPMQWGKGKNAEFSRATEKKLYLPVDPAADRPTVAAQDKDGDSLLQKVRALIHLRRAEKALGPDGELEVLNLAEGQYPLVYLRQWDGEQFLVAINPAARQVGTKITLPGGGKAFSLIIGSGVIWDEEELVMDGASYGIFSLKVVK